jgi:hypothetical protein
LSDDRAFGSPPPMQACNCLGPAPGEHLCPCMKNQQARQEAQWRRDWQEKLDSIPAVAPDNDPEDTIARFDGLHVSMPPFPGYQSRKTIEEQYDPADERAANGATIAAIAFVIGVIVGSVLSLLSL